MAHCSAGRCALGCCGDRCGRELVWDLGRWVSGWSRWLTVAHALAGLSLLALAPAKLRGSVRTGLKRRRASRWLSMLLGALIVATVVLGVLHATGLWHGVGYWSALWTHVLLVAFVAPLLVWHIVSRAGASRHRRRRPPGIRRREHRFGGGGRCLLDPATGGGRQPAIHRLARDRFVQPRRDADDHVAQRQISEGGRFGLGAHGRWQAGAAGDPPQPSRTVDRRPRLHRRMVEPSVVGRSAVGRAAVRRRRTNAGSHFADRIQPPVSCPRREQSVLGRRLRR